MISEDIDSLIRRWKTCAAPSGQLELVRTYPARPERAVACDWMQYDIFRAAGSGMIYAHLTGGIAGHDLWFGPMKEDQDEVRRLMKMIGSSRSRGPGAIEE